MRMDFKHFKKLHEDEHTATLKHPDGHEVRIAKKGLTTHLQSKLRELKFWEGGTVPNKKEHYERQDPNKAKGASKGAQEAGAGDQGADAPIQWPWETQGAKPVKYAEGGDVAPMTSDNPYLGWQEKAGWPKEDIKMSEPASPMAQSVLGLDSAKAPISEPAPSEALPTNWQPEKAPQPTAIPQQAPNNRGMNEEIAGIRNEAKATGQQGMDMQAAAQEQQAKVQQMQADFQAKVQANTEQRMAVIHDLQNGHIDPNHYVSSMSDSAKTSTAIGLLLSGIGSGMSGQENAAMKFLDKQIDRDIEGQKADMNNKHNILTALNQEYGNIKDASTMARIMQGDMYAAKIQETAAKSMDPMAKARAQQAIGQIHAKNDALSQQLALRQTVEQGAKNGTIPPEQSVQYLVPKEHQKEVFAEIGRAQNAAKNEQNIMGAFDRAAQENTVMKTGAGMLRTPASVLEARAFGAPLTHDLEGRVNEYELKLYNDLLPAPGDTDEKIAQKRQAMANFISQKKATPTANGFGVHIQESNSTKTRPNPNAPKRR